ncbi:MAG TPA: hypothetical protein DDW54_02345 [Clostridiales bacterium]|nr:hypothetical protein [Clostridiales bacterium]
MKNKSFTSGLSVSVFALTMIILSLIFSAAFRASGADTGSAAARAIFQLPCLSGAAAVFLYCRFTLGKEAYRFGGFKAAGAKYYGYAALLLFAMFFGLSGLNNIFTEFLKNTFGYESEPIKLPDFTVGGYILTVFSLCVVPAASEEAVFRGFALGGIKGNKYVSALITGFLFAVYHMNPTQTAYQFAVGFLLGLLSASSGSVFPCVAVHFLNNFAIITLSYFVPDALSFSGAWKIVSVIAGAVAAAAYLVLIALDKTEKEEKENYSYKNFMLGASVAALAFILFWTANLVK